MLRLLIDQDLDHDILRGLLRRVPDLDAITAYEVGKGQATDPELLAWAAEAGRVLVTHDRRTMPSHAARRLAAGDDISGVIIVSRRVPINTAIQELEIVVLCSDQHEWRNLVLHIPL
jgi:hypothetical protein